MRFDIVVVNGVYPAVASAVSNLAEAGVVVDAYDIDEIVYVGGMSCLN